MRNGMPENCSRSSCMELRAGKLLHAREHGPQCSDAELRLGCSRIPLLRNFREAMTAIRRRDALLIEANARASVSSVARRLGRGRRTRDAMSPTQQAASTDAVAAAIARQRQRQQPPIDRTRPSISTSLQPSARSVPRIMGLVLLALLPAALARIAFVGADAAWQLMLAIPIALGFEAAMLKLRRQPARPFLGDLSAPLSAVLLALLIPPVTPWWMLATGLFVAIVLAKHAFGGLGENPVNPAMAGYAALLICFPSNFVASARPWTAGGPHGSPVCTLGGIS
jgi:hypothetical protein